MTYLDDIMKLGDSTSQILQTGETIKTSILDTPKQVLSPGGGTEDIKEKGGPIAQATTDILGGYGLETVDKAGNVVSPADVMVGGQENLVTTAKKEGGLISEDGKLAKLADNKIVKYTGKQVGKAAKAVGKEIATNPNLAPTQEFIEQVGKPATKVAKKVVKGVSKTASSKVGQTLGSAAGVVGGLATAAEGIETMAEAGGDEATIAAGGMTTLGGIGTAAAGGAALYGALTGAAVSNFWNPVGWVAGALAIGGTLLGASKGKLF